MTDFTNIMVLGLALTGSLTSGIFMYDGLVSREEKRLQLIMAKRRLKAFRIQAIEKTKFEELEATLREAGNPFSLNAFRYQMIRYVFTLTFLLYYYVYPLFIYRDFNGWALLLFGLLIAMTSPKIPFSVFSFVIKKLQEIHRSKKNNEIFQLHDSLISEFELMDQRQVNTYHVLKRLYRNFEYIQPELQELLQPQNWKEDPAPALDRFANQINTTEAHMLVSILEKFDQHTDRDVALSSLESNSKLFSTNKIENYRMRLKLTNDLALIPIFLTHMLILGVFIGVIVNLAMQAFDSSVL